MEFSKGYIFEKKTKKIVENENDYKFLNWENKKIVAIIVPITCEGTKGNIWWKEGEGELAEEKKSQRKTVVTEKDLQAIVDFVGTIQFGAVTIVIQDGKVIQLEKSEKLRIKWKI